jgi:hypothetical protein
MAWADFNNDGLQDLYLSYGGMGGINIQTDKLYKNMGNGTFANLIRSAGLFEGSDGGGIAFGDYDNDGDLDLYRTSWTENMNRLYMNEGSAKFEDVTEFANLASTLQFISCSWADINNDGYLDLYLGGSGPDSPSMIFKNNQNGTFTDVTAQSGLSIAGACSGIAFCDYDNDRDQDLLMTTYDDKPALFNNVREGVYENVTVKAGIAVGGMGWSSASWGDYNNDGNIDIFLTNWGWNARNHLYKNNGDGTFSDVSSPYDFPDSHGATWGDYDNDGYLDLFISTNSVNEDHLLFNNGGESFTDVSAQNGIVHIANTLGSAWADYDRNGFLDLYVMTFESSDGNKNLLYYNYPNDNNWLIVDLEGTTSNRCGIGTRIIAVAGDLSCTREVDGGTGLVQNSLPVEFGIGKNIQIDSLILKWPSGVTDIHTQVQPNQYVRAIEGERLMTDLDSEPLEENKPTTYQIYQNYPNPFNNSTRIDFAVPEVTWVTIKIYNMLGQEIITLADEFIETGYHSKTWDTRVLPSGIYFCKFSTRKFHKNIKMLLMK